MILGLGDGLGLGQWEEYRALIIGWGAGRVGAADSEGLLVGGAVRRVDQQVDRIAHGDAELLGQGLPQQQTLAVIGREEAAAHQAILEWLVGLGRGIDADHAHAGGFISDTDDAAGDQAGSCQFDERDRGDLGSNLGGILDQVLPHEAALAILIALRPNLQIAAFEADGEVH